MKKRILFLIIGLLVALNIYQYTKPQEPIVEIITNEVIVETETIIEKEIPIELNVIHQETIIPQTYLEAEQLLQEAYENKSKVENILNSFIALGNTDNAIIEWADKILSLYNSDIAYYQEYKTILYPEYYWGIKSEEYPTATYVWLFLKEQGFNDYVAAGIMGNMMTECGGQTLSLNEYASSGSYYGICQWGPHFPSRYTDLEGQCTLLMNTIENEFNWYGNISYSNFLNLNNEQEAALAFAKSYERCTSASYSQRQYNASIALAYFSEG